MSLLKTPKKRRSRSQLASAIALANRVTRGCDLCDITHKCGGVVHTKDPIQKLKIGITDTDYICQCGVCKRKFQDPTIPVPGHSDLVLPGFSCLSSIIVYAFICTHAHCKKAVKYVGHTTQTLDARMGTHKSTKNPFVKDHDLLHKGHTKLAILEAWTNGRNLKKFMESRECHWTKIFQTLECQGKGGLQMRKPHGSRCNKC